MATPVVNAPAGGPVNDSLTPDQRSAYAYAIQQANNFDKGAMGIGAENQIIDANFGKGASQGPMAATYRAALEKANTFDRNTLSSGGINGIMDGVTKPTDPSGLATTATNDFYGASPNAAADDTAMFRGDAAQALAAPGYQAVGYGNGDVSSLADQTNGQLTAGVGLTDQQNSLGQYLQMANGQGPTTYQNQYAAQYQQAIDQANKNAMSLAASAQGSGLQRGAADLAAVNQGAGATQAGAAALAGNDAQAAYAQQLAGMQGYQTGAQALTTAGNATAAQNASILSNETQLQQQDQLNAANVTNQQQQQALQYQALGQGVQQMSEQGGQAYEGQLVSNYGIATGQNISAANNAAAAAAAQKTANSNIVGGVTAAVGGAAGLVTGGPAGAAAGAAGGMAAGKAVSNAVQSDTQDNTIGNTFGAPTGQADQSSADPNAALAAAIQKKTQNPNGLPAFAG